MRLMIMDLHVTMLARILLGIDTVVHRIMLYVAEIALLVMVCIVTANVFVRLFIPSMGGFAWIEEVAFILIGLFTFLACSMGVRDRFHIGIAILYNRFGVGSTSRRVLDIVSKLATFAVGATLFSFGMMNASANLTEEAYTQQYTDLTRQYEEKKAEYESLLDRKKAMEATAVVFSGILFRLTELEEIPIDFDEALWNTLVDHVTVYADERIMFSFMDGTEITEMV